MSFLHKPKRMWWRKAAFQIHLWTGVVLCIYVAAIGLSGSILVFYEELRPKPERSLVPAKIGICSASQLVRAIETVSALHKDRTVTLALCPTDQVPFIAVTVKRPPPALPANQVIFVHPTSGALLGTFAEQRSWVDWVGEFHFNLWVGPIGRIWNGVGAVFLLLMTATGILLWWPGIYLWKAGLVVNFRRRWKRINYDLHSAVGFWALALISIWAISGTYFAWPEAFVKGVSKFSPVINAKLLFPVTKTRPSSEPPLNLTAILAQAQAAAPQCQLAGLFYGLGDGAPLTVYMARVRPGDYDTTEFVYFNPYTGAYLDTWRRGIHRSAGDFALWVLGPLHFGMYWGLSVKILWCLFGLSLPLLTTTGLIMYWNRSLSGFLRRFRLAASS
jgi:uncharacterized iron-regulated membrane protein